MVIVNDPQQPASDRVAAANVIRSSLESNAVSSVPEIWYSVKQLINPENQAEVRRAGWRLMQTCVSHDEINVGAFNSYYRTLIDCSNIEDFDLILQVLQELTNNGRRITLGQTSNYRLPTVLLSWLQLLALRSREIRNNPGSGDIAAQWGTTTPENFVSLLVFIVNVLKFAMTVFEEKDLLDIVLSICAIMRTTSSLTELEMCCNVIDTVMAFGIAPLPTLRPVVEVLCGINLVVEKLADQTWRTVQNLCRSHLAYSTVVTLCRILQSNSDSSPTMREGAVRMLTKVAIWFSKETPDAEASVSPSMSPSLASMQSSRPAGAAAASAASRLIEEGSGLKEVPLTQILAAFSNALDGNQSSAEIVLAIAAALRDLLSTPALKFDYDLWQSATQSPLRIVYQLADYVSKAERLEFTKAGWTGSDIKEVNKPTDEKNVVEDLGGVLSSIFSAITQRLTERDSYLPLEEVCLVCVELAQFLDEPSLLRVLDVCIQIHMCSPYMDNWQDRLNLVLTRIYRPPTCPSSARLRVLVLLRDAYMWAISQGESQEQLAKALVAGQRGPAVEASLSVSLEDFFPITDRVFGILYGADSKLTSELLGIFERLAMTNLHLYYDRVIDILMAQFPDQSARRVTSDETSEQLGIIAGSIARVFALTYKHRAREARIAYVALVQICRRSFHDPAPFQQAFAILSRIRAGPGSYIMLTEPAVEPDYGLLASQQVPAPYVTEMDVQSSVLKRVAPLFSEDASLMSAQTTDGVHVSLDTSTLLNVIFELLQNGGCAEAYAQVLINLPSQLANTQLYQYATGDLVNVRNLLLTQLTANTKLPTPSVSASVGRQDYVAVIIHALTILISYDEIFQKADYDKLVQTLALYMNRSWDNAAKWAIHCLVLCCYECPESVQRYLPQLLNKFQTKMSSREASTHILEFILTVSAVEKLTDNFNFQEYKRVFGMCFTYIQDANYHLLNKQKSDTDVDNQVLSQYLLRLAYSSIRTLFLSIDLSQRRSYVPYLVRNLVLADGQGESMSLLSMVTFDMVRRYTYSDLPLTLYSAASSVQTSTATTDRRRWLVGHSIYEFCTDMYSGESRLVLRRPVGTLVLKFRPELKAAMAAAEPGGELYSANFWFLSLYSLKRDGALNPLPIPDEPQFVRAVNTLDRAPVLDLHKAGVIYIGPGQRSEEQVLSNVAGSPAYNKFLRKLGRLIRLKNNRDFYVGGLDTEMDLDGKYAYGYQTMISQLIFHVTTMMPNREDDRQRSSKKRHIGNNFVNIYFDESGFEFDFDLVKSQFNFINIVITPTYSEKKWRVRAYRKEGLANVLAAYELKAMSEDYLSQFVRHLVTKASQYATVYNQHGEYTDNWTYRLQLIENLRQRLEVAPRDFEDDETASTNSGGVPGAAAGGEEENGSDLKMLEWLDISRFTI